MSKIKAILFDMDGVLIDAREWHYEALNKALGLFGLSISRYDHLHTFDGLPTRVKLQMIAKADFLPLELHGFINEIKQQYTEQEIYEKCHPMFSHEYALSKLKKEGYRMAVCSNSIRRTIELMMQRAALDTYLELIVSNEDVKKAKPDPEIYQFAMNRLGLLPDECIVVEDNPHGIQAGEASGAKVLRVTGVEDVNYRNIRDFIKKCEVGS